MTSKSVRAKPDCFPGYSGFEWEPYRAENLRGRKFTDYERAARINQVGWACKTHSRVEPRERSLEEGWISRWCSQTLPRLSSTRAVPYPVDPDHPSGLLYQHTE